MRIDFVTSTMRWNSNTDVMQEIFCRYYGEQKAYDTAALAEDRCSHRAQHHQDRKQQAELQARQQAQQVNLVQTQL